MPQVVRVAVENATLGFDKLYSYLVPAGMPAVPGCRVTVPFGAGNRTRLGLIMEAAGEESPPPGLKEVSSLVDAAPLLDAGLLALVAHLRETTFCCYFDAVKAVLPPGIGVRLRRRYQLAPEADTAGLEGDARQVADYLAGRQRPVEEEQLCAALGLAAEAPVLRQLCGQGVLVETQLARQRVLDERQVMVRLDPAIQELADVRAKLTARQKQVVELLLQVGAGSLKEVCYFAGVGRGVVDRLEKAGVLELYTQEVYRNPYAGQAATAKLSDILLSQEQQAACSRLCALADTGKPQAALLYGVTGSGKTEVFLRVLDHVLQGGRGAIVLVPEISLTPQTVERFHRYFGQQVAVLHSGLSMSQRMDEWKRIKNGDARIVVGTRSAVFAPVGRLGLIVMDEEQEGSYKSEKAPRYHARDVARWRAAREGALLLLASATPSIESYWKAQQGRYTLLTLKHRYGNAHLPDVTILDMSLEMPGAASASLSARLVEELGENLRRGEQSILLLNRRGYNTLVKCAVCSTVATCPNCSVALTYHSANGRLICHYCGHIAQPQAACPVCGNRFLRFSGAGTQKVEEELHTLFPQARVLRMDLDTTMSRFSHERYFNDISAGKYDIVIGTQMVAKGLDFPNVTLVGVLSADAALYAQDYRSYERAFSLFTQVVGRSGRAQKAGRAYIQTFTPENSVIALAAAQDYDSFYAEEIESRRIHLYPPFCDLVGVGFSGPENPLVRQAAQAFLGQLKALAQADYPQLPLRVLGPCENQVLRIAGKYRWHMAVKCRWDASTRQLLRRTAAWYARQGGCRGVALAVDPRYESAI